ncbi:hypothetical protein ABZ312_11645 [Streptomyces sp. NPDC006207]
MDTSDRTAPTVIECAACEDQDGPFKPVDGIYICETCLNIADDAQ